MLPPPLSCQLNHGIELSPDGRTLYASTQEFVYAWDYDPGSDSLSNRRILVQNMTNPGGGHNTRTLLLSRKQPDLLLVSRGSAENIDQLAALEASGISQIRAFNVSGGPQPYSYPSDGILVGWGLRNSVGVAEHPETGGLWSVENSADDVARLGRDIHEDNPGEELNFHGRLADAATLGANHGYPHCFALWNTTGFPRLGNLTVGDQFALLGNDTAANTTASVNDTTCAREYTAPRLTFTAHMAPLDIKFEPSNSGGGGGGRRAFVTFHGSWNREVPAGYKLSYVDFSAETGEPVEPADSVSAAVDVLWSPDLSACPRGCVRPVGLAFDTAGEDENDENDDGSSSAGGRRLFVTSDSTGEIWVVVEEREEPTPTSSGADGASTSTVDGGDGGGSGEPDSTSSAAAAPRGMYRGVGRDGWVMIGLTLAVAVAGGLSLIVGGL